MDATEHVCWLDAGLPDGSPHTRPSPALHDLCCGAGSPTAGAVGADVR